MKLISTSLTDTEVVMRFADDEDAKKAKQSIEIRAPISELKVPVREGWLRRLDRQHGLVEEPDVKSVDDSHTISEIRKAALDYAQKVLKRMSPKQRS